MFECEGLTARAQFKMRRDFFRLNRQRGIALSPSIEFDWEVKLHDFGFTRAVCSTSSDAKANPIARRVPSPRQTRRRLARSRAANACASKRSRPAWPAKPTVRRLTNQTDRRDNSARHTCLPARGLSLAVLFHRYHNAPSLSHIVSIDLPGPSHSAAEH